MFRAGLLLIIRRYLSVYTENYIIRKYCLCIQKCTSSSGNIFCVYRKVPHHQEVLSVYTEKYLIIRKDCLCIQKCTSSSGNIVCAYRKVPHHQEVLSVYTEKYLITRKYCLCIKKSTSSGSIFCV